MGTLLIEINNQRKSSQMLALGFSLKSKYIYIRGRSNDAFSGFGPEAETCKAKNEKHSFLNTGEKNENFLTLNQEIKS